MSQLNQKVISLELFFKAFQLRDADWSGKSDPMLVVYLENKTVHRFEEVGRTEVQPETLTPEWNTSIVLDYSFAEEQKLRLQVFDVDDESANLAHHDDLGYIDVELGVLLQKQSSTWSLSQGEGQLSVVVEKKEDAHEDVYFDISCTDLKKMDFFGKSDGFLEIYRDVGESNSEWVLVHTTEVVDNSTEPHWKPFSLTSSELCNSDHYRAIKFECYDSDGDDNKDWIGSFVTNLNELENGNVHYDLVGKKDKVTGKIQFNTFRVVHRPSFTDFLSAGMPVNVDVYIDFTGSNGDPSDPRSLHYYQDDRTQYEEVLEAVGNVVFPYDTNNSMTLYGFGGIFDGSRTSHCHELGSASSIEEARTVYRDTIRTVTLSGKTYMQEIVSTAISNSNSSSGYSIMLILIDGVIHDKVRVKKLLHQATRSPLSVIVAGIGNADFSDMEDLDDLDVDEQKLRDVVQFVPFNRYRNNPRLFAKQVLQEVPTQVEQYMQLARRRPEDFKAE